ncbi:hypothetical protein J1614_002313 [Plenodomus biglobosus]|nr:hypothetical protein J1614_002313 [Plenodomus biglobosus]
MLSIVLEIRCLTLTAMLGAIPTHLQITLATAVYPAIFVSTPMALCTPSSAPIESLELVLMGATVNPVTAIASVAPIRTRLADGHWLSRRSGDRSSNRWNSWWNRRLSDMIGARFTVDDVLLVPEWAITSVPDGLAEIAEFVATTASMIVSKLCYGSEAYKCT